MLLRSRWLRSLTVLLCVLLEVISASVEVPASEYSQTEDHELELLVEIYRENLIKDSLYNGQAETDRDLHSFVEQRVRSFLRDREQDQVQNGRTRRDTSHSDIEADTAEARHLYLKGFRERGYVPVNFPVDICLLRVGKSIFAAALHQSESSNRTQNATAVSFYRRTGGKFEKYLEHQTVTARYFDCISIAHLGFVAVVNYHDHELDVFKDGSPVFQIHEDGRTEIVQTFGQPKQNTVHLWVHGKHIYLTHTYLNLDESLNTACPIYRWTGYYFDVIDHIPCQNAVHIEAFSIDQQMYVAVANQMSADKKDTFSVIYLLNPETLKLNQHQQIYSYSVSHIAYYFLELRDRREHFLITGNSVNVGDGDENERHSSLEHTQLNSIVYKLVDGYFVPFQNLELTGVDMFLPVVHENGAFLLLVLCSGQPLQIFEYDGWKLVPSRIDYTGEAFAAGVSHMRVYRHIVNASVIAIANSNLFGMSVNLFTPQYGVENDLRQVYAHFIEWCDQMQQQMANVDLEELYNKLVALPAEVPDGVRLISKNIELQDSSADLVTTAVIQTPHLLIDEPLLSYAIEVNEYVKQVMDKMERVEQTINTSIMRNETVRWNGDLAVGELIASSGQMKQLDVKVLNNAAYRTRSADEDSSVNGKPTDDTIEVDRLIIDRVVRVGFWNGHAADSLLLTDDDPAKWKDLTVSANKVIVEQDVYVNKLIDGIFFHPSNVLLPGVNQVINARHVRVTELNVNRLKSKKLNSTESVSVQRMMDKSRTLLAKSRGALPHSYRNDFDTVEVEELMANGLLNNVNPQYLLDNVLLVDAEQQQMNGKLIIEELMADNIALADAKLSSIMWEHVARTTGNQRILQDLQFVQPITVDSLQVHDRLNHIPVMDGKLQVLLLRSNETQTITGTKTFDCVTVLNPIDLQGKIDGEGLSKMNPIVTIEQELVLNGDYAIDGNVSFNGAVVADNIFGKGGHYNLQRLAKHGIRLNESPTPEQMVKFLQPVFVENLYVHRINELAMDDLVRQNSDEIQYLTGRKTFIGDLLVEGIADSNEINKVDLNQLNRTIFRRDAGEQTIEGDIRFAGVGTATVYAKSVSFAGKPIDHFLRLDRPQNLTKPVRFVNCTVIVGNSLATQHLVVDNSSTVYGQELGFLLQDTLYADSDIPAPPIITGKKIFRNITIGRLFLAEESTFNGIPLQNLRHILAAGDNRTIIKNGPYSFRTNHELKVDHLLFEGMINGIPKAAFCRAWLMHTGNQTFTAGQTIQKLDIGHVQLSGNLNGIDVNHLLKNAYRADVEEYIHQAVFHDGVVSYEPVTVGGLVAGINISSDVLLKQSAEIQALGNVHVAGTLNAKGQLHILQTLNGIHFPKMMEFFGTKAAHDGASDAAPMNIEVHGNVYFEQTPTVINLNGYNVQKVYGEVWLPQRPTVLTGRCHFESVEFLDLTYSNNHPINYLDLAETEARCLSGRRPQNITAPLVFEQEVLFNAGGSFRAVDLKGLLKSINKSHGIDIKEYDNYVFRYGEDQDITGNWLLHNVAVHGTFDVKVLNGFNIETELLRSDVAVNNVTAAKHFRELHVDSIICPGECIIQGVDMKEWFANALRLEGNQTIEGTLHIDNPVITGNIDVLGTVNGVRFDAKHLMLKSIPQKVPGTLHLITKFPSENKIYPLIFESLHTDMINGRNFTKFLMYAARTDQNPLIINTPITLAQPIEAEETLLESDMLFGVNTTQLIRDTSFKESVGELTSKVRSLNSVNEKILENVFEDGPIFSHFDKKKPLLVKVARLLLLTVYRDSLPQELLVVHSNEPGKPSAIEFYRWLVSEEKFVLSKRYQRIVTRDREIVKVRRVRLGPKQHLFVEFFEQDHKTFTQQIMDVQHDGAAISKFVPLYVMKSNSSRDAIWMKLVTLDCIVMYTKGQAGFEVRCLREENLMHILDVRQVEETVVPIQIIALENHLIILDSSDQVQVWRSTAKFYLKHHQTLTVSHPSYVSVARYENQLMLAISSEHTPNSAHYGSIEIWQKTLRPNGTFTQHQLIWTKVPKQLQFSVLPSKELMLYTLTENWLHPLVVYRYEGVTGFRELLSSNTIQQKAHRLAVLKLRLAQKEFVAILGPQSTDLVEVVFV
ncbi:uncharacterized protein LOC126579251 [Anopheles aquasalis]|nr:uncharacterized protein LOC126579251 [Anopheles aquasalis]